MTRQEIIYILNIFQEANLEFAPKQVTEGSIKLWFNFFKNIKSYLIQRAVVRYIESETKYPAISNILRIIDNLIIEDEGYLPPEELYHYFEKAATQNQNIPPLVKQVFDMLGGIFKLGQLTPQEAYKRITFQGIPYYKKLISQKVGSKRKDPQIQNKNEKKQITDLTNTIAGQLSLGSG